MDFTLLELLQDLSLEVGAFREPSHHEDEINILVFVVDLANKLFDLH